MTAAQDMRAIDPDLNVLAVASLVLGILGYVALPFVAPAAAIITGEIAKRQIARTGQAGFACARWGGILGALWFLLVLATGLLFFLTFQARG